MEINKKQEMYNSIKDILINYKMIHDCIFNVVNERYPFSKGKNDSFKLGYIFSETCLHFSDINFKIEDFDAEFGDELKLEDTLEET